MIIPVILSGGSGTRLWPLSKTEKPKQFLPLVGDRTLFEDTLLRLEGLPGLADPIVVCNESHRFLVAEQLREIGTKASAIVLEPVGRNTAPAIAIAAMIAARTGSDSAGPEMGSDPILLVLPADHVIADPDAFREAIEQGVAAARTGKLVTFGIVPTHPETGYGYIEQGASQGGWSAVARFVEKPDAATAQTYVDSGRFLWNSGMFVFGAAAFLDELGRHAPAIRTVCESALSGLRADDDFTRLGPEFLKSPSDSVDYAVMEKTDRAAVVPLDAGWSDVGSWGALFDVLDKDKDNNVLRGNVVTSGVENSLVISGSRKVLVLGLHDVIVVDDEDALLIMRKGSSQDLKLALAKVKDDSTDD
jgi:mannose-1-phosphate guanylyltransferase/mannose-6-phosphate isomerase